jgi:hypothetical protein
MDQFRKLRAAAFAGLVVSAVSGCSMFGMGETVTFKTVKVQDTNISLAQYNAIQDGKPVRCRQYIERVEPAADGSGFSATIGRACHRI